MHLKLKSYFILMFSAKPFGNSSNICYFQEVSRDYKKSHSHFKMLGRVESVHVPNYVSISLLQPEIFQISNLNLRVS